MTDRQKLQMRVAMLKLEGRKPPHPTLGPTPVGKLSDAQLAELIDYYSPKKAEAVP